MRRLWNGLIIRLFWTKGFDEVRTKHYLMGYGMGKHDEKVSHAYENQECYLERFIQMERLINEN
ncbi:hypothetical protein BSK50_14125 [Paenibacillus odorifer]|nr:hypothetical protein BSK50_14125 [Paenibacillus odorifer]